MASIAIASIIAFYVISFKINNPFVLDEKLYTQYTMYLYSCFFLH